MKKKILLTLPLVAMAFGSTIEIKENVLFTIDKPKVLENVSNENNINGKDIIWQNEENLPLNWGDRYRFSYEGSSAEFATQWMSVENWAKIKQNTFYIDFEIEGDDFVITVIDSYWGSYEFYEIKKDDTRILDNKDGTWTLEINLLNTTLVSYLDYADLLIVGSENVVPKKLYFATPDPLTVNFDMMGYGLQIEPYVDVMPGSTIDEPDAPTAFGFIFDGWYKNKEFGEADKWDFTSDVVETDTTLYAKWEDNVEKISVNSLPKKVNYILGEDLDLSGLKIKVMDVEGKEEIIEVTNEMVSGYDKNKVGKQTLMITYGDQTATFEIEVKENNKLSSGVLVAIVAGGLLLIGLIILLVLFLIRRKKEKNYK